MEDLQEEDYFWRAKNENDLETGYYWTTSKIFEEEPRIMFYDSLQECFFEGSRRFYSDEVKVVSPRIEEPII